MFERQWIVFLYANLNHRFLPPKRKGVQHTSALGTAYEEKTDLAKPKKWDAAHIYLKY